jgi:hypothetical protein
VSLHAVASAVLSFALPPNFFVEGLKFPVVCVGMRSPRSCSLLLHVPQCYYIERVLICRARVPWYAADERSGKMYLSIPGAAMACEALCSLERLPTTAIGSEAKVFAAAMMDANVSETGTVAPTTPTTPTRRHLASIVVSFLRPSVPADLASGALATFATSDTTG